MGLILWRRRCSCSSSPPGGMDWVLRLAKAQQHKLRLNGRCQDDRLDNDNYDDEHTFFLTRFSFSLLKTRLNYMYLFLTLLAHISYQIILCIHSTNRAKRITRANFCYIFYIKKNNYSTVTPLKVHSHQKQSEYSNFSCARDSESREIQPSKSKYFNLNEHTNEANLRHSHEQDLSEPRCLR